MIHSQPNSKYKDRIISRKDAKLAKKSKYPGCKPGLKDFLGILGGLCERRL